MVMMRERKHISLATQLLCAFFFSSLLLSLTVLHFFFCLLLSSPIFPSSPLAPYGATACVTTPLGPFCTAAYSRTVTEFLSAKDVTISNWVLHAKGKRKKKEDAMILEIRRKIEVAAFTLQSQGTCTGINRCQHAILTVGEEREGTRDGRRKQCWQHLRLS